MQVSVITTQEFFNGQFTTLVPRNCEAYGWHMSDFKGLVYEARRFNTPYYLIPTTDGQVLSYKEFNGQLICVDWCKPSELFPELRAALA